MCKLNIYLCFKILQSQEVKEDKKFCFLCNHIFLPSECSIKCDFSSFEILCRKVKTYQFQDYFYSISLKIS